MYDRFTINARRSQNLDGSSPHIEANVRYHPLLFEMLRSFTTLAATLNLSHAVRELGSTRQTVRRHISQLEEIKGGALFQVTERQYELTELGRLVLPEAQDLLARAEGWVNGVASLSDGLQKLHLEQSDGWCFHQQQHPIGRVFTSTSDLLPSCMEAWAKSGGQLEAPAMQPVREYLTVFRRSDETWLCVELGDKSAFVSWFGWKAARSSIGRELGGLPGGPGFARLINHAFLEVETNQSVRLDHTFTLIPRVPDGPGIPCSYERLLMASRFPDGSFALIQAVRRTYDVDIIAVSDDMLRQMPEDMLM